uniref:RES family NAD+ phosphorylase n=1 Tax=uncultured Caulobacter sp. TaxID=158749 RepID=UPI0025FACA75|nr:RES domain-containing protein [uncultured Caulobacter sp.]
MKTVALGPDAIFHRYLTPRWAYLPTSGAGAASQGGRFNRPGVEALYLSVAPQTALDEYRQDASITPPATLAAYQVTLSNVADLSAGYDPTVWATAWSDWDCAWRRIARLDGKTPPSWLLADNLVTAGVKGLLFPSLRHAGGVNLVVFLANLDAGDRVEVHDPDHRLPRNPASWH